jgi:hypothetical protein
VWARLQRSADAHPSPLPPLLQDVRVTIDGLWHEEASDLRISLVHGAQEVFLVDRGAGVCLCM